MAKPKNEDYAIFSLRIGLGLFLLVWGLMKFVKTDFLINKAYAKFWGFLGTLSPTILFVIGTIQIVAALMLIVGWKTTLAAWAGGIMHLGTVLVTLNKIFAPFTIVEGAPPNFFFFTAVPVLFAFLALILLGRSGAYAMEK